MKPKRPRSRRRFNVGKSDHPPQIKSNGTLEEFFIRVSMFNQCRSVISHPKKHR